MSEGQDREAGGRADPDARKLDRRIDRFAARLPDWAARALRWLRSPLSRWVRLPLAVLLIAGGFVGFLPLLGFWMIPLGALLLAQDVPAVRRMVLWLDAKWRQWRARRRS